MSTAQLTITDAAIRKHAKKQVDVLHDQQLHPLYFRYHQSRDSGGWYLVQRRKWRHIGRWPEVGAALVRKKAPRLMLEGSENLSIESNMELGDVLTWFRHRSSQNRAISEDRRADIETAIKLHLLSRPALCALPVTGLRKADLDASLMLPIQQQLQASTIQKVFRVLKQATKVAHGMAIIGEDPLAPLKYGDFIRARITEKPSALRPDSVPTVIDQLPDDRPRQLKEKARLLAALMLMHATRINETRLTRLGDFDLRGRWWHIPAANTKTGKALRLPLTDAAILIIERFVDMDCPPSTPLLANPKGEVISRQYATQLIRSISGGRWSAHDLRKLARTVWADLGIDYMISELLLNHTPSKLDKVYIHTYADQKTREALEKYHHWLIENSQNDFVDVRYALDQQKRLGTKTRTAEPLLGNQFTDDRGL